MTNQIKKVFICCIVFSLVLTVCPSFAANIDGLEQAILTAKSKIEIPENYTQFDSNIGSSDKSTEYYLSWRTEDEKNYIEVTINDRGDILRYRKNYNTYDYKPKFAKFTTEELYNKALEWINKVNPEWTSQLVKRENDAENINIHNERIYISFNRYVNGIKFLNDYVSFSMSNQTGDIINMSSLWTYADGFSDGTGVMETAEALEKYLSVNPLELKYDYVSEESAKLIYETKEYDTLIDAYTGEKVINHSGDALYATEEAAMDTAMSAGEGSNYKAQLSEKEIENLDEVSGLLPEDELRKKAVSLKHTGLNKAEFKEFNIIRGYGENGEYRARLVYVFNERTENEYYAYLTMDAKTGEIISYHAYNYNNKSESKADLEKAKQNAEEFASIYAKDEYDKAKIYGEEEYTYNFVRYENDIPYPRNFILVEIDEKNGNIRSFTKEWYECEFESPDGILDLENAKKAFLNNIGLELVYEYSYTTDKIEPEIKVCYRAKKNSPIEAKSGDVVSDTYNIDKVYPDDVSGHYAEKQINKLIDAGLEILADEDSFMPDYKITYEELTGWVSQLMYGYWPKEAAEKKELLVSNDIIAIDEEFEPGAAAMRIDGPTYIIRALGYREIAELQDIYRCNFKDADLIPTDKIGYAAIAKALKIVSGDESGNFNPTERLSRADAAIMLYNYLSR